VVRFSLHTGLQWFLRKTPGAKRYSAFPSQREARVSWSRAMRAVERRVSTDRLTEGVMDDFAAPRAGAIADPAFGGYRVMRHRPRANRRPLRSRPFPAFGATRGGTGSFLTLLLAGGLGLAVLAGPASCPCDLTGAAGAAAASTSKRSAARFAYSPQAENLLGGTGRWPSGASPISTSAIEPATAHSAHIGALPATIEDVSDSAPKPLRLAAVTESDAATLPVIEVENPPMPEILAIEAKTGIGAEEKPATHRHKTARHHARGRAVRAANAYAASIDKLRRAPRWAQQMYVTPWQSKAFSYQ
jgi:hypothetical protein